MTYTPFKCPDCKVWWRGETHACKDVQLELPLKFSPVPIRKPNASAVCFTCSYRARVYAAHDCEIYKAKRIEDIKNNKMVDYYNKKKGGKNNEPHGETSPYWNS